MALHLWLVLAMDRVVGPKLADRVAAPCKHQCLLLHVALKITNRGPVSLHPNTLSRGARLAIGQTRARTKTAC